MCKWISLLVFIPLHFLFPKENLLSFENLPDKIYLNTEATVTCKFKNSQVASIKKWTWRIELWDNGDTFTLIQKDSTAGTEQSQWSFTIDSIPDYAYYGDFYHYDGNYHRLYSGYILAFAEDSNNNYYSLINTIRIIGKSVDNLPGWYCCGSDFVAIVDGEKTIHKNESLSYTSYFFDDDESGNYADYWDWRMFTYTENGKYIINSTDSLYGKNGSIWEFNFDSLDSRYNYVRDTLNDIIGFITTSATCNDLFYDFDMNKIKILTTPVSLFDQTLPDEKALILYQNYPNPFNPATIIQYNVKSIHESPLQHVELTIYNILGQEIAKPVNEKQSAGLHKVEFNANALPSGIYIYKLRTNSFEESRKMMLLR